MHCFALVQQFNRSVLLKSVAALAADSEEAHTDVRQTPDVARSGEAVETDEPSVLQCEKGSSSVGHDAASDLCGIGTLMPHNGPASHTAGHYILMVPIVVPTLPLRRLYNSGSSSYNLVALDVQPSVDGECH